MIDLKIKITGLSVYDEETPLEFSLEEAKKLYEELGNVFGSCIFIPTASNKTGHKYTCMCDEWSSDTGPGDADEAIKKIIKPDKILSCTKEMLEASIDEAKKVLEEFK